MKEIIVETPRGTSLKALGVAGTLYIYKYNDEECEWEEVSENDLEMISFEILEALLIGD